MFIQEAGMAVKEIISQAEAKMKKSVEVCMRDFSTVRTGRASPTLVEGLRVDYYGTPTPLKSHRHLFQSPVTPQPYL